MQECGDNTTFIGPCTGAACRVPVPRRVQYNGVAVAPRSEILIFVGWSRPRQVNSWKTVRVTSGWYSRLAELFRSRGSPPPWPARCPVVPPRGGARLVAE
jgi:hypothetical protein